MRSGGLGMKQAAAVGADREAGRDVPDHREGNRPALSIPPDGAVDVHIRSSRRADFPMESRALSAILPAPGQRPIRDRIGSILIFPLPG